MKPRAFNPRPLIALAVLGGLMLFAGACNEGVVDDAGHGSSKIAGLWWLMFWLSVIPIVIVGAAVVRILVKRRRGGGTPPEPQPVEETDDSGDRKVILLGGVVLPLLLLIPVAVMTLAVSQSREADANGDVPVMPIEVTAHQFWWDVRYPAPGSNDLEGETFRTANEIHIPVGRPVEIVALADDVIHSFWVPELDGKIDMIPGHRNTLRIQADRPGTYTGRCAEFCGLGHGVMRLLVVALEEEEFQAWYANESTAFTGEIDQGTRQDFGNSCAPCHVIRGLFDDETFEGSFGPDLTHFANRSMIGAGVLANTRESLGRWIADPQGVKPGNRMPDVNIDGGTMGGIVDFLEQLE